MRTKLASLLIPCCPQRLHEYNPDHAIVLPEGLMIAIQGITIAIVMIGIMCLLLYTPFPFEDGEDFEDS
jgi:hypothetical protein